MAKSVALFGAVALAVGLPLAAGIASCSTDGKPNFEKAASTVQMSVEAYCALPEAVRVEVRAKVTGGQQLLCN